MGQEEPEEGGEGVAPPSKKKRGAEAKKGGDKPPKTRKKAVGEAVYTRKCEDSEGGQVDVERHGGAPGGGGKDECLLYLSHILS